MIGSYSVPTSVSGWDWVSGAIPIGPVRGRQGYDLIDSLTVKETFGHIPPVTVDDDGSVAGRSPK